MPGARSTAEDVDHAGRRVQPLGDPADVEGHRRARAFDLAGPGFAPEILDRIGEPYLTSRGRPAGGEGEVSGLGLGVFIAKTLLERSGAALIIANRAAPEHGAMVRVRWRREDYERVGAGIPAAAS